MLSNSPLIELQNPIILPAPLSRDAYRIESRFGGRSRKNPPERLRREPAQLMFDNRLCHAVCHSGHPEDPLAPLFFGMETARTGGGK